MGLQISVLRHSFKRQVKCTVPMEEEISTVMKDQGFLNTVPQEGNRVKQSAVLRSTSFLLFSFLLACLRFVICLMTTMMHKISFNNSFMNSFWKQHQLI